MSEKIEGIQPSEQDYVTIPFYVSEKQIHRLYKIIRMLVVIIIVMFLTFAGYVFYESQFETITISQEATTDGQSQTMLNGTGELTYNGIEGETNSNDTTQESN